MYGILVLDDCFSSDDCTQNTWDLLFHRLLTSFLKIQCFLNDFFESMLGHTIQCSLILSLKKFPIFKCACMRSRFSTIRNLCSHQFRQVTYVRTHLARHRNESFLMIGHQQCNHKCIGCENDAIFHRKQRDAKWRKIKCK